MDNHRLHSVAAVRSIRKVQPEHLFSKEIRLLLVLVSIRFVEASLGHFNIFGDTSKSHTVARMN